MEKIFAYSEIGVESLRYHIVELACFDYINARRKFFNLARKTQKPTMEILTNSYQKMMSEYLAELKTRKEY